MEDYFWLLFLLVLLFVIPSLGGDGSGDDSEAHNIYQSQSLFNADTECRSGLNASRYCQCMHDKHVLYKDAMVYNKSTSGLYRYCFWDHQNKTWVSER